MKLEARHAAALAAALIVMLLAVGILLYYAAVVIHAVPVSWDLVLKLVLAFGLGYAAVTVVERILRQLLPHIVSSRRGGLFIAVYRIVAYSFLALVLLILAGVNSLAVLTGGTFAGLVLGLAGQTVLANVIAGIMLIFARPMEPGERVTITTWQYGLIAPAYPPKFYSQDFLIPGYTGTVAEFGLVYSRFRVDDGTVLRIPNNILIQAAVVSHEVDRRWVRLKYEVPSAVDPAQLLEGLRARLTRNEWVVPGEPVRLWVNQAMINSYVLAVDALCRGNLEEPPRSALLIEVMATVRAMGTGAPPGPPEASGPKHDGTATRSSSLTESSHTSLPPTLGPNLQ
jgi:small-conductance mechanosensitive channel